MEAAGLRHLRGLFLVDVQRADGPAIPSPPPTTIVLEGDKLTFAGDINGMQSVLSLPGLTPLGGWVGGWMQGCRPGTGTGPGRCGSVGCRPGTGVWEVRQRRVPGVRVVGQRGLRPGLMQTG